jgi:hypothetical protein
MQGCGRERQRLEDGIACQGAMAEQTDALTSSYALRKCKLHIPAGLKARSNGH